MPRTVLNRVKEGMCIGVGFSAFTEEGKIPAWFWYYGYIQSVEKVDEGMKVKVQLNDKTKAIQLLLKEKYFNVPSNEEPDKLSYRVLGWTLPKTATDEIRSFLYIDENELITKKKKIPTKKEKISNPTKKQDKPQKKEKDKITQKKRALEDVPEGTSKRARKKQIDDGQITITQAQLNAMVSARMEETEQKIRQEVMKEVQEEIKQAMNGQKKEQHISDLWKMITPKKIIPKDHLSYNSFWPKVRDGFSKFPKLKGSRICCARYRHISSTGNSECLSAKMTPDCNGNQFLLNKNAAYVPIAAITIDANIKNKMDVPCVVQAHEQWMKYRACKACSDHMSLQGLMYVKYINKDKVWDHCVMCLGANGSEHVCNGLLKLCKTCLDKVGKDGNTDGDDWTDIMRPIPHRNLEIDMEWRKMLPGKLEATFDPDTSFVVNIKGRKLWVLIEEDGSNQHNSNAEKSEYDRMVTIIKSVLSNKDTDVLFLRFSPKGRYNTGVMNTIYNVDKAVRLLVIRQWVIWGISQMSKDVFPRLCLLYMFFDHNNKHYMKAKSCIRSDFPKLKSDQIKIGFGYTWPQEIIKDDGEMDFRYALTLNEGTLMQKLGSITGLLKLSISDVLNQ